MKGIMGQVQSLGREAVMPVAGIMVGTFAANFARTNLFRGAAPTAPAATQGMGAMPNLDFNDIASRAVGIGAAIMIEKLTRTRGLALGAMVGGIAGLVVKMAPPDFAKLAAIGMDEEGAVINGMGDDTIIGADDTQLIGADDDQIEMIGADFSPVGQDDDNDDTGIGADDFTPKGE